MCAMYNLTYLQSVSDVRCRARYAGKLAPGGAAPAAPAGPAAARRRRFSSMYMTLSRSSEVSSVYIDRHLFMAAFSPRHAHATLRTRPRAHLTNSGSPTFYSQDWSPSVTTVLLAAGRGSGTRTLHEVVALAEGLLLHLLHELVLLRRVDLNLHGRAIPKAAPPRAARMATNSANTNEDGAGGGLAVSRAIQRSRRAHGRVRRSHQSQATTCPWLASCPWAAPLSAGGLLVQPSERRASVVVAVVVVVGVVVVVVSVAHSRLRPLRRPPHGFVAVSPLFVVPRFSVVRGSASAALSRSLSRSLALVSAHPHVFRRGARTKRAIGRTKKNHVSGRRHNCRRRAGRRREPTQRTTQRHDKDGVDARRRGTTEKEHDPANKTS